MFNIVYWDWRLRFVNMISGAEDVSTADTALSPLAQYSISRQVLQQCLMFILVTVLTFGFDLKISQISPKLCVTQKRPQI